jgi:MFS family permease
MPTLTNHAMPVANPPASGSRLALAGLSLVMLLSSLGTGVANVALPTLQRAFDAPFGAVQWVVLAYLLAVTTLVVSAGRLGDLVGRRRALLAGVALFTLASALSAAAPGLWTLVVARALQGVGAAAMMALSLALVVEVVPASGAGRGMGLLGSTSAVGTALGPSLGGLLIAAFDWRAVFLVNVPLGVAALVVGVRSLPADRPAPADSRPRFDLPGTLALVLTLGAAALAVTAGPGGPRVVGLGLPAVAAAGAVLLVAVERRAPAPLMDPALLRDRRLVPSLATATLVSTVMMAMLVVGPFHLSRALGLGTAAVGLVMSAGPAVVALVGVPAGHLADRFGARRLTLAGLGAMLLGALLLSLAPVRLGVAGYLGPILVMTLGYALFQTANNTAVMAGADPARRGVVSGMLNLSRNLGLIAGASAMGAVFALASGTGTAGGSAAGMHATFAVAAALLLVALAVAVRGTRAARR